MSEGKGMDMIVEKNYNNKKNVEVLKIDNLALLTKIWKEELEVEELDLDEEFYALGGDSLAMFRIIGRIKNEFGIGILPTVFIQLGTIRELYHYIQEQEVEIKSINLDHKQEDGKAFPLTLVQKAYLSGRDKKFLLGGIPTHICFQFETNLELNKLEKSLNELIQIQPMLKAVVEKNGMQRILSEVPYYVIGMNDISFLKHAEKKERIKQQMVKTSETVFEFGKWPMFAISALKLEEGLYELFMNFDLMIMDGGSIHIFLKQLSDLYHGKEVDMKDVSFKDFILYLDSQKDTKEYIESKKYWLKKIENFPQFPLLPMKKELAEIVCFDTNRCQKLICNERWKNLEKCAFEHSISPSVVLLTAYAETLQFWSGQNRLALNITVLSRPAEYPEMNNIIGDFTSVILLDLDYSEVTEFWKKADITQSKLLEAMNYRYFDGIEVMRELTKKHSVQSLMPVVFTSMLFSKDIPSTVDVLGPLKGGISQTAQVFLDSQVMKLKQGILLSWDYIEELFEREQINDMFQHYANRILDICENRELEPFQISQKDENFVVQYNNTDADIKKTTFQEEFMLTAARFPNKVAVKDEYDEITYSELDKKSNQMATFLNSKGIRKNSVVGILGVKKIGTIINIIGILKAGAAYVAVDPDFPKERVYYILRNSGSDFYLTPDAYEIYDVQKYSIEKIDISYDLDSLAYIIYTSGSTGTPKGVAVSQAAVMNTVLDINMRFKVGSNDRVIGLSSLCFDLSVYDVFGSLVSGATLIEIMDVRNIRKVAQILKEEDITVWNSVPAIMEMLIENLEPSEITDAFWEIDSEEDIRLEQGIEKSLRLVLLSGDWIPLNLPFKIKQYFENIEVISLGGATEASIWSIYYPITAINPDWKSIPYGYPLTNQKFYVLNHEKQICPIGVPGELYIGGCGVAAGYQNDEEKTKENFIEHPDLGRLYKTGDFGKLCKEGYIEFLGRKDQQVKISGYRIELGEIESCLEKCKAVKNAVVVLHTVNNRKYLCAYIVSESSFNENELMVYARQSLPDYMVPQYYIKIDKIPLTVNGKVNKKALPFPKKKEEKGDMQPETETEKTLESIWKQTLNISNISINESFLRLGGDSLLMVRVISKIAEEFGVEISFHEFLRANTIYKLSHLIDSKGKKQITERYTKSEGDLEHIYEEFPLTNVQMAYLMGRNEEYDLGGVSTHAYYEIETRLNIQQLEKSLNKLIKHQAMLRAIVLKNGVQKILNNVPMYKIVVRDISESDKKQEEIACERERMSHYVFDTEVWPLFEIKALKIDEQKHLLLIGFDLLIMDGSSLEIFVHQWLKFYKDEKYSPVDMKYTFRDYVFALKDLEKSRLYLRDKGYWENKLKNFPNAPMLPIRHDETKQKSCHFSRLEKQVTGVHWKAIKELAQNKMITTSALLCTLYSQVLGYWSNQERFGLNVTIFTRYPFHDAIHDMIGDFTSVMLLDINISLEADVWENANAVQHTLMEAFDHRHYDGIDFIRALSQASDEERPITMPVVFTSMLSSDQNRGKLSDLGEWKGGVSQTSQVYLDHQVMEMGDGILLTWDYADGIFDHAIITAMFEQYIESIVALAEGFRSEHSIYKLTDEMYNDYNDTNCEIRSVTMQEAFMETAKKYPEHIAVKIDSEELTYNELDLRSNQVANYLLENGFGNGTIIGVSGERVPESIVNIMGVLKAGSAYVAVDPEYPQERRNYILSHSQSGLFLTKDFYKNTEIKKYSFDKPKCVYNPADTAYIIYTSGSTGTPKGVEISHDAAMNTILDINKKFGVNSSDRFIALSSMSFDLSVYDIFGCLSVGATLIQIPDIRDVRNVLKVLQKEQITIWNSVPAIMDMMLDNAVDSAKKEVSFWEVEKDINIELDHLSSLRLVLLSGDWIPLQLPKKINIHYPDAKVVSLGGATESSIWSIYYPIDRIETNWKSIPYGWPLANQKFYILNCVGNLCPIGVPGELFIGGRGLAKGYKNDSKKTNTAFIQHKKFGKIYRTGDYGVMHKEGFIEFLGRKDQQVKISGHRIELGEIENCILKYNGVRNAAVIVRDDVKGHKFLCGYIVSDNNTKTEELQKYLATILPEYMLPQFIIKVSEIPLTSNGKVDKKRLPDFSTNDKKKYVEPQNEIEKKLVEIWSEVLEVQHISTDDSFLKLGGDSIMMVRVISKIADKLSVDVTFKEFMSFNTIQKLAELLSDRTQMRVQHKYKTYKADVEHQAEKFPLTDVQMAYLMGRNEEFALGGTSTHGYYEIETKLDIDKFNLCLNKVICEQPMLRAIILESGEQMILGNVPSYKIQVEDMRHLSKQELQEKIHQERERMSHHIFQTDKWPLFEFKAFKISEHVSYLFVGIDLLICDGSSMRILVKSLMDLYNDNREFDAKKVSNFTFRDYVLAFEDFKNGMLYQRDRDYWLEKLDDFPLAPSIPLKARIEDIKTPHFRRFQRIFGNKEWDSVKAIAKDQGITPSVLLCTIYSMVLGYWSNQPRHALNLTVFTRYPFCSNVDEIIGDFTSVMLLDIHVKSNCDIWKNARSVQEKLMEALEHRHYDGINFIREIAKRNSMQQQAVMPIVFTSMLFTMKDDTNNASFTDFGEIKMGVSQTSQVYLDYQVMETKEGLSITWDYVEELFDNEMIEKMFQQYVSLLDELKAKKEANIKSDNSIEEVVQVFNSTMKDIPRTTIQEEFRKVVMCHPQKIAVRDRWNEITFEELDKKSNQVAAYLLEKGIHDNSVIAVLAERKLDTIVNILGILKTGSAYVAIDPEYPKERQRYILENSSAILLLTPTCYEENQLRSFPSTKLEVRYSPEDVAYIIYTSGSTGNPKGVVITQSAVMNTILDINQKFSINSNDNIIGLSSMCFDLSVFDIFSSLTSGATLVQIPDLHDMKYLADTLQREKITIWNSVPAVMDMLMQSEDMSCDSLRCVLISGDWIPLQLPTEVWRRFPNASIISLGGATEASIWSIYYPIMKLNTEWSSIPYGMPLANQQFYVLNYEKKLCPMNVPGELYIGGVGLAKEYKNDEEKTAQAFVIHPRFGRLYRTGDYGVMREQGYIEFLGRKDQQVKISGHRIELGEIENKLLRHPEITNTIVVDRMSEKKQKYLCAYYTSRKEISSEILNKFLSENLPSYMLPQYYVAMQEFPLTTNGKIDRKKLPNPEVEKKQRSIIKPQNNTEKCLMGIWQEILGIDEISMDDSFLRLGGDSIMMVKVISKISQIFRVDISFTEFMKLKNINNLSALIDKKATVDNCVRYESYTPDYIHEYDPFPLTDVQLAYFVGRNQGIRLGGVSTHGYYEVETKLNIEKLNESLNKIIELQPMLRVIVHKNGEQQILKSVKPYQIVIEDASCFNEEELNAKIRTERERMSHHIFVTDQWPLFEIKALRLNEGTSYLFLSFDLLIMDGTSMGIFIRQWLEAYYGILDVDMGEFTFRDYVMALDKLKQTDVYRRDCEYWLRKAEDFPAAPNLPLKQNAEDIKQPHFERKQKFITNGRWDSIKELAQKRNVTPSAILGTIYAKVLAEWSNQNKLGLNVTIFNRYPFHKDVQGMIGDFTSVILLDIAMESQEPFWETVKKVQATLFNALEHRHYDGIKVIREIAKYTSGNQQAVMPIVFTSMISSDEKLGSIYDLGTIKSGISQTSQVYLDYQAMETREGLSITWDYVSEIFTEDVINGMFEQYIEWIEQLIVKEDIDDSYIPLQTKKLVSSYNNTVQDIAYSTIPEEFAKVVQQHRNDTAVINGNESITYDELDKKSDQVALYLIKRGVKGNSIVAVIGKRKISTIINILGIMKAGAAYVAIDPEYPDERKNYILKNSNSCMLLDDEFCPPESHDAILEENAKIIYDAQNIAYVIYTSGSTGRPKGVVISQSSVMNTIRDINEKFHVTSNDRIIGLSSMCFDLSVYDIFGSLLAGATLVQIEDIRDVRNIVKTIYEAKVTIWNSVPAIMDMVLDEMDVKSKGDSSFWEMEHEEVISLEPIEENHLRLVLLSGDWIPLRLPEKIREYYTNASVISLGGATEASIWSIYYPIHAINTVWKSIPYGYPLTNQTIYILNYKGKICPIDVPGELFIGGKGVAEGYLNDPEKTSQSFINHPEYGRLYRTGDYGVLRKQGYIEFLGRKDQQIKISGHRIELGEIENSLIEHPAVSNAIVVDQTDRNGVRFLSAYYIESKPVMQDELKAYLLQRLPEYMIPKYFKKISEIPLTTNGKVDRRALPLPNSLNDYRQLIVPRNKTELDIAQIWKSILGVDAISIRDNFFRLGGDSIGAIKVYSILSRKYELNINDIFKYQTIETLAQILQTRVQDDIFKKLKEEYYQRMPLLDSNNTVQSVEEEYRNYKERNTQKYAKVILDDEKHYTAVLLTGVTGYLGAYLLKEYLEHTDSQIYTLVRADNNIEAEERLRQCLLFYFDSDFWDRYQNRIKVLKGDIGIDKFGVVEKEYQHLSHVIEAIINCAANVSHFGLYEELYKVNTEGVKHIIDFAETGRKKDIFHMSTTTIASGSVVGKDYMVFTEDDLDVMQKSDNVYVQTKMEAEKILVSARKRGVNVSIFRIGNISFHSLTGKFQKNIDKNAFYSMLNSYLEIGVLPDINIECLEISYVDYVSRAIFLLSSKKTLLNETFHIRNSKQISFRSFENILKRLSAQIKILPYDEYINKLEELYRDEYYKENIDNLVNHSYILPWHSKTVFYVYSEKTDMLLERLGFQWKKPGYEEIRAMLVYGMKEGFFK